MKVVSGENIVYLYLHKEDMTNIYIDDLEKLEDYFRTIFHKLKNYYNVVISGFYDIDIYLDDYYGSVIEMKKELIDYYEMYENEVDMRIIIHNAEFLYKVEDYFSIEERLLKKIKFYKFKGHIYGKIIEQVSSVEMARLLENSEIIYHTEDILKYGKVLGI